MNEFKSREAEENIFCKWEEIKSIERNRENESHKI